ncbi:MAG: 4Fe-4S dicluster domain-containing protein [Bacilli bacterium]|nr:4Fe-4S dicluster domain-containing protein [Bacilli bacterium]
MLSRLVFKKYKECKDVNCLRCGKCASVCPAYLVPVMIKDNIDNVEKLKELHPEKCIGCGLCSYVCPSKINVRDYIDKAKQVLKERK